MSCDRCIDIHTAQKGGKTQKECKCDCHDNQTGTGTWTTTGTGTGIFQINNFDSTAGATSTVTFTDGTANTGDWNIFGNTGEGTITVDVDTECVHTKSDDCICSNCEDELCECGKGFDHTKKEHGDKSGFNYGCNCDIKNGHDKGCKGF